MNESNQQHDINRVIPDRPPLHIHFERLLNPDDELYRTAIIKELLPTSGYGRLASHVRQFVGTDELITFRSLDYASTTEMKLLDVLELEDTDVYQAFIWHQHPKKTVNLLVVNHDEEHVELWSAGGQFRQRVATVDKNDYI